MNSDKTRIELSIIDGIIFNKSANYISVVDLHKIKISKASWGKFKNENGFVVHWTKKKLDQLSIDFRLNFINNKEIQ